MQKKAPDCLTNILWCALKHSGEHRSLAQHSLLSTLSTLPHWWFHYNLPSHLLTRVAKEIPVQPRLKMNAPIIRSSLNHYLPNAFVERNSYRTWEINSMYNEHHDLHCGPTCWNSGYSPRNLMTHSAPTNFQNKTQNKTWVRKKQSKELLWPSWWKPQELGPGLWQPAPNCLALTLQSIQV